MHKNILKQQAERNIKLHGLINLIFGIAFLLPIITLFYKYSGLSLFEIIIISNVATLAIWIFELPTSVIADTMGRKKSLMYSVVCNLISALFILVFPSFYGFIIASIFSGLCFSFWSGTGQAYLEENLHILEKKHEFGKTIGAFIFYGEIGTLITPLIASLILKLTPDFGFTLLAGLDVLVAIIIVYLVYQLTETTQVIEKFDNFKHAFKVNLELGISSLKNVMKDQKLRLFLIYRSLSHHLLFLEIMILPILSLKGMPNWGAGFVATIGAIGSMFASKYAYKIGEKYSYNFAWILGTTVQGIILILIGLMINSWIPVIILFFFFNVFDGIWQPSWNHILVDISNRKAIATTRSIIMAVFSLYITIGKQALAFIQPKNAFIIIGIFIIFINIIFAKKIYNLKSST